MKRITSVEPGVTLVEASAGTGKTHQITSKVLELVAVDAVPIQRIAVVTFTEAATSELRDRIRARLRDASDDPGTWLPSHPEPRRALRLLSRALVDFDLAPISTIHGACARILRRHALPTGAPLEGELVPNVADLVRRHTDDVWANLIHDAPPALYRALHKVGLGRDTLAELVKLAGNPDLDVVPPPGPVPVPVRAHGNARAVEFPDLAPWDAALAHVVRLYEAQGEAVRAFLAGPAVFQQRSVAKGRTCAYPARELEGATEQLVTFLRKPAVLGSAPLQHFTTPFLRDALRPGQPMPGFALFGAVDRLVAVREDLARRLSEWALSLQHRVLASARERIPAWKLDLGLRTFDDLLRDLRAALRRDPGLADKLAADIDVALVDEFQDTDAIQWEIFQAVHHSRLWLVGDPKQAIYRFRGADVHTYRRAANTAARAEGLPDNWRTDAPLVEAVSSLFRRVRRPFHGTWPTFAEVRARRGPRLLAPGDGDHLDERPPLQVRFVPRPDPSGGPIPVSQARPLLIRVVAEDVTAELHRRCRIAEDGDRRAVGPSDCAVLTRTNEEARAVQQALRELGVPSVVRARDPVPSTPMARELGTVLAAIASPDDLPGLRRALVTPLLGRSADDLLAMRADDLAWADVRGRFRRWNALWRDGGFIRSFRAWVEEEGVLRRLLRRSGGERDATDLLHLGELLHGGATRERHGPDSLVAWLRGGAPSLDEGASDRRRESGGDAVRIYTVHSAKGLEFPLVWCPFLGAATYLRDSEKARPVWFDHTADRWKLDLGSAEHAAHVEAALQDKLEEDIRLIYVALTRARHRCVVYWGAIGGDLSALGYLLHQDPQAPDEGLVTSARERVRDDATIAEDLDALASSSTGISWDLVAWAGRPEPIPWTQRLPDPDTLHVKPLTRGSPVDTWWRRSSYTDLLRGRASTSPADVSPVPERQDDASTQPTATGGDLTVLHDLRGGTHTGNLVHAIFEHADYTDPEHVAATVRAQLPAYGLPLEPWAELLTTATREVLATPLDPGDPFRLETLPRERRSNEHDFTLALRGGYRGGEALSARALAAVFETGLGPGAPDGVAEHLAALGFLPVRGFLAGSIDLMFSRQGKVYLVDWKSSRLGDSHLHYAPAALAAEMLESLYVLQYHLYTVAVHRLLRHRLGRSTYDYDSHFGGVYYLFVRGMSPRWGPGFGVFRDRPPAELIDRLDAALKGGAP